MHVYASERQGELSQTESSSQGQQAGEHSGVGRLNLVGLPGEHRYMCNERGYDGVSQRGWYRGFILILNFPVPESADMLFWDFFFLGKNALIC